MCFLNMLQLIDPSHIRYRSRDSHQLRFSTFAPKGVSLSLPQVIPTGAERVVRPGQRHLGNAGNMVIMTFIWHSYTFMTFFGR